MTEKAATPTTLALGLLALFAIATLMAFAPQRPSSPDGDTQRFYLGFDRNIYPGDDALPALRKTFLFSSFWLSAPPGEQTNTWHGKRETLLKNGFGFVVLYRGREEKELKSLADASNKGQSDAHATIEAAEREGFGPQTIIYLDIEEGGRLSPAYHRYLNQWLGQLTPLHFQGGFYCSGIPVKEDQGKPSRLAKTFLTT